MSATPPLTAGPGPKGWLLRIVAGTLFSVTMAVFIFAGIHYAGLDLAKLSVLDIVAVVGILFWATTLLIFLIGRLPLAAVIIVFVLAFTFGAVSIFLFLSHRLGLALLPFAGAAFQARFGGKPLRWMKRGFFLWLWGLAATVALTVVLIGVAVATQSSGGHSSLAGFILLLILSLASLPFLWLVYGWRMSKR